MSKIISKSNILYIFLFLFLASFLMLQISRYGVEVNQFLFVSWFGLILLVVLSQEETTQGNLIEKLCLPWKKIFFFI